MRKNKNTLLWLWQVAGKSKLYVGIILIIQIFLSLSGLYSAILLKNIINSAVAHSKPLFFKYILFFIFLTLGQILFQWLGRLLVEFTRATTENTFKSRLFSTLMAKSYADVTAVHSGEWINRLTSDTVVVSQGITEIVPGLTGMIIQLTGAVVLLLFLEPLFLFLVVPGGIILVFLTYFFRKILKGLHKSIMEADGRLRVFFQERLSGLLIVKTFSNEEKTLKEADKKMGEHKRARMKRCHFSNLCNAGFGFIMNGAYIVGAAFCGYGILTGTMSYGTFTAVLQLVNQIQSPFANISGYLPKYYAAIASGERLMEAESLNGEDNTQKYKSDYVQSYYKTAFKSIEIKNVSFSYTSPVKTDGAEPMPRVLNNVSLSINKGDYVALAGHSGCGKSTLLKLLLCLYKPTHGEILLKDSATTQPLTNKWQKLFSYVPQGSHLMSGSIREAVTFSSKLSPKENEEMINALKIACAYDFVKALKQGADTVLGENGAGLSEGQLQRLSIARAIYTKSPILILDEATSALDEETERQLLNNLRKMTDKTVLIITHRPAALNICNKIIKCTEKSFYQIK